MLKDFFSRFFGGPKSPPHFYEIYVQCDKCGEIITAHINMQNDLSIQYGENDKDNVYFVRKQLLGSERCYELIDVELAFDNRKALIDQNISGGRLISRDEFEAGQHA